MTHIPLKRELKPCPFCGETGLDFDEGSTFRWLLPSCKGCGAVREYGIGVARLAVGMQWQWKTPSGALLPLPAMPMTTHERLQPKDPK